MGVIIIETFIGYIVALFIFQPLSVLIHELGHAFFAKLFGGKIVKLEIGIGEPLFSLEKFQLNKYFFIMGYCSYESNLTEQNRIKLSLIALGGVFFNLATIVMLILIKLYTDHSHFLDGYFFGFTGILVLFSIIPVTYFTGDISDGKWLIKIWKH